MSSSVVTDAKDGIDSTEKTTNAENQELSTPRRPMKNKKSPSARRADSRDISSSDDSDKENRSHSRRGKKHRSRSSDSDNDAKKQKIQSSPRQSDDEESNSSGDESGNASGEEEVNASEYLYREFRRLRQSVNKLKTPMEDCLKSNELKPLVEALDKHRTDVNSAVSTEKAVLKELTSALKKQVKHLKDASDDISEKGIQWESALKKINDLTNEMSDFKTSMGKLEFALGKVDGFATGFQLSSTSQKSPAQPLVKQEPGTAKKPKKEKHPCVFCDSKAHKSKKCELYGTYETKIARSKELGICVKCCQKYIDDGTGVHKHCRAHAISCSGCSKFLSNKDLCKHNPLFCSVKTSAIMHVPKKQDANKQSHGSTPPLQGMFNVNK